MYDSFITNNTYNFFFKDVTKHIDITKIIILQPKYK